MSYAIDFAPHVPMALLWALGGAALLIVLYSFAVRARGAWARGLVFAIALLVLANPLIVHETREPLSDVVALIVDHSQSMEHRRGDEDDAVAQIKKKLAGQTNLTLREGEISARNTGEDTGTQAFAALNEALADVPQSRVAGATHRQTRDPRAAACADRGPA